MRIKDLNKTIEDMRETHNFTDNATIRVSKAPNGADLVEIGVIEDGTQVILSREVELGGYNPITGEDYD